MMHTEIVSAVAEGIKFIVVLVQNHGYASIGHLSEDVGSQRFGTQYRFQGSEGAGSWSDDRLPVDLATNAESLGIRVIRVEPGPEAIADLAAAVASAKASTTATLIHINSDPLLYSPDGGGWWDVPVAEVSTLESTSQARTDYEQSRTAQKPHLGGTAPTAPVE
jgi:3D-(3,5/4)-trihydroxycyclohexane-1,2-dione acylhydrolase (decyclizing)